MNLTSFGWVLAVAIMHSLSWIASTILLYILLRRAQRSAPLRLVYKAMFFAILCQWALHLCLGIQHWLFLYNPHILNANVCPWFGFGLYFTGIGNFMWSLILAMMLLWLLRGRPLTSLHQTVFFQHLSSFGIASVFALVPLFANEYYLTEAHCGSNNIVVLFFYGVCAASLAFNVVVLVVAAISWRQSLKQRTAVKIIVFVTYFAAIWLIPCFRKFFKLWSDKAPSWLAGVHASCVGVYGTGSLIVYWVFLSSRGPCGRRRLRHRFNDNELSVPNDDPKPQPTQQNQDELFRYNSYMREEYRRNLQDHYGFNEEGGTISSSLPAARHDTQSSNNQSKDYHLPSQPTKSSSRSNLSLSEDKRPQQQQQHRYHFSHPSESDGRDDHKAPLLPTHGK